MSLRRTFAFVATTLALIGIVGCTPDTPLSPVDRQVIDQLGTIAPQSTDIDGAIRMVECWRPTGNLVEGETFRVLCRVHYEQNDAQRYRDMICVGELRRKPVTDYCYEWAYYSDMPAFEDEPGHRAEVDSSH